MSVAVSQDRIRARGVLSCCTPQRWLCSVQGYGNCAGSEVFRQEVPVSGCEHAANSRSGICRLWSSHVRRRTLPNGQVIELLQPSLSIVAVAAWPALTKRSHVQRLLRKATIIRATSPAQEGDPFLKDLRTEEDERQEQLIQRPSVVRTAVRAGAKPAKVNEGSSFSGRRRLLCASLLAWAADHLL